MGTGRHMLVLVLLALSEQYGLVGHCLHVRMAASGKVKLNITRSLCYRPTPCRCGLSSLTCR